jgi:hypothetical protein
MNKFTLRPKDLLIYAITFAVLDIIVYFAFNMDPSGYWLGFGLIALFEAFHPSNYHQYNNKEKNE